MKDIIERLRNDDQFVDAIDDAIVYIQELRSGLNELTDYYKSIMEEPCGDEVHCTCVPALRRKLIAAEKLAGVIKAAEWEYDGEWGDSFCPACNNKQSSGHGRDCPLAAALAEWGKA